MRDFNDANAVKHPAQRSRGLSIRPSPAVALRPFRTMPRIGYLVRAQHHDCHRDVVQRAEPRAGDDDRIEIARLRKIEHGVTPARAAPSLRLPPRRRARIRRGASCLIRASMSSGIERHAGTLGRDCRRERLGELQERARQRVLLSRGVRQHLRVCPAGQRRLPFPRA